MKNFKNYIIEKLHLNKDIKVNDVLKPTVDNFAVGDLCLYLTHVSSGKSSNPSFVTIDVVQVKRILSTSIICNYKTAFSFGEAYKADQLNFKYTYHQDNENVFIETYVDRLRRGTLIPTKYCKDVIEYIDTNKKISFYDLVRNKYKNSQYPSLVVEAYLGTKSLIWKNVTGIKQSSIDKIKEKLGL